MFAIRATASARRRLHPILCRANATLQSATTASSSTAPPPPVVPPTSISPDEAANASTTPTPTPTDEAVDASSTPPPTNPTKPIPTRGRRRPNISLSNPRPWNRPVPEGFIPAYDEALKLIQKDSQELKEELQGLRARIEEMRSAESCDSEELDALMKKAEVVEIQSEINLPDVRWYLANGMGDMSKPVYRHLAEQKWRNKGALDLLMERIHQMHVIPDLLPTFHPSFDLRVSFPEPPPKSTYLRTRVKRRYAPVEPGVFLLPEQTWKPPKLYTTVFHPETRYYTLLLVDADVPDPENNSFTTYLHWMQTNIPLSPTSPSPLFSPSTPSPSPHRTTARYIPPHPQRGSPYHRYCLFLLPNPSPSEKVAIPTIEDGERRGFSMRAFCEKYGFGVEAGGGGGGGAHMWRERWDETVGRIYAETLRQPEPHYALPPRRDPYEEVKSISRYAK